MFKKHLKMTDIYSDKDLQNSILKLEEAYTITDGRDMYKKMVNFSLNREIPYHGWFTYREGYSSLLIKDILEKNLLKEEEYVFDPFCGSGTTTTEAALNDKSGLGIDINPMSAFVANVKSASYTEEEVEKIEKILCFLELEIYEENIVGEYEEKKYFSFDNYIELMKLKAFIKNITYKKIAEFFYLGFLSIIMDVSDRKRDGNGLKKRPSKVENVKLHFINKIKCMINDIKKHKIEVPFSKCIYGNACQFKDEIEEINLKSNMSVGLIIFSPPYANSFDYFESYKLELLIGDFVKDKEELKKYRSKAVSSFISKENNLVYSCDIVEKLAKEIERSIPIKEQETGKRDSRTRKVPTMLKKYFLDMELCLKECYAVLNERKKCYIVVDQSSYLGKIIPTDLILAEIGEKIGFEVEEVIVARNATTSGQQLKKFPYLKEMLRESIIVLKK